MDHAVRVGLRGPDVVVDCLRVRLTRCIELKDRHHFARSWLFDQVVILEAPRCGCVRTETTPGVAGAAARSGTRVEDANLQNVAGLGPLDRHGAGEKMNAEALSRSEFEFAFGRSRAAAPNRLLILGPVE